MQYFHRQPWARSAYLLGQTDSHPRKKEKLSISNKNNKDTQQRG
jgi:hypothetical protein